MGRAFFRLTLLCLIGLLPAVAATAFCKDDKPHATPPWPGEYGGEKHILKIDGLPGGRSFRYSFKDRERSETVREGEAGVEENSERKGSGEGFDFVLSTDNAAVTVTAWQKPAAKKPQDAQWAGRYVRLDSLKMEGARLVWQATGQPLPEGMGELNPVQNADLRFAAIGMFDVEKHKLPLRPGVYLAHPDGRVEYFEGYVPGAEQGGSPEGFGDMTDALSLSPDKDVLAVSWFGTLNGEWFFFSWPEMKPLGHPRVDAFRDARSPPLIWSGKRQVVVDVMDLEEGKRQCGYDPCGPVSVVVFDLDTGKTTTLLQGTQVCDYCLKSVEGGRVTATKLCLPSVEAWREYPKNALTETATAALP